MSLPRTPPLAKESCVVHTSVTVKAFHDRKLFFTAYKDEQIGHNEDAERDDTPSSHRRSFSETFFLQILLSPVPEAPPPASTFLGIVG